MFKSAIKNKKTLRFGCALLAVAFFATAFFTPRAAAQFEYSSYMVRVGLKYGTSAVNSATLRLKSVGFSYGYKLGYYDANRKFIQLYDLRNEADITVIRSYNYNILNDTYVSDGASSTYVVGAYHLELNVDFDTQAELDAAVARVRQVTNYYTFPAFTRNGYRVRIGRYTSLDSALADEQVITERLKAIYPDAVLAPVAKGTNAYTVLRAGTRNVLYEFDGATKQLAALPYGKGDETETTYGGYTYLGGFDFAKVATTTFSVVSVVNLNQYVKGVTPYELGPNWPMETLKAHAVCAASYVVYVATQEPRHNAYGFDVCTGQHCQVYQGSTRANATTNSAVDAVKGVLAVYNGKPIMAVYHSTNGGYTENSENVWTATVPYLRAVPDPFETLTYANYGLWTTSLTGEQISAKLKAKGYSIGTVVDVWVSRRTVPADNVYELSFRDASGKVLTLQKETMRTVLGTNILYSQRFEVISSGKIFLNDQGENLSTLAGAYAITANGKAPLSSSSRSVITSEGVGTLAIGSTGTFTFDGKGFGHSLGVSQYGSKGMADRGYTYDQILKYYFTGIDVVKYN